MLQQKEAEAAKAVEQLSEETSAAKGALMHALQASSESLPISACGFCSSLFVCCAPQISGFACMSVVTLLPVVLPGYRAL
jgi:hypothetical protein